MALKTDNDINVQVKVEFETSDDEFVINMNECQEGSNKDVVVKVEIIKEEPIDYELGIERPIDNSVTECPLNKSIGTTNYKDNRVDSCNALNEIYSHTFVNKFPSNQSNKKLSKEKKITYKRTFVCTSCNKKFTTKDHMKRHVNNHCRPKQGPFICDLCDMEYRYKSLLIVHIRSHTGERPFTCNLCGKKFCHRSGVNKHKKIHTEEKSFHCNVCDRKFRQKYDLKLHMLIHTGEKLNACYLCDKKFRRKYDLNVHIRTHTGEKPYGCNLCKKKFNTKFNLVLHKKTHMKEICKTVSNSTLAKHKKPRIRRPITKKCVLTKDTKTHHPVDFESSVVQAHTNKNALQENISFRSKETMVDKEIENNTKCYIKQESIPIEKGLIVNKIEPVEEYVIDNNKCVTSEEDFVKKEFDKEESVMVERWPVNKPVEYNSAESLLSESKEISDTFTCDICNRQFTTKRNLRRHIIIHSDNRSFYICKVCKRRCLHKKTLAVHMRTHTGEKPFGCTMCDKKFRQKCDLTKHIRAHTGEKPFSCQVCNRKFSQKYNLQMHTRTHSGERPYACDECEKTFLQKCSLTKHKKTHSKEKPFRKKII